MDKAQSHKSYFARKKAAGLCYCCWRPATHGVRCDFHFEQATINRRKRLAQKQVQRRCRCGAALEPRRLLCVVCREANKKANLARHREGERQRRRSRYKESRKRNLCVRCNKARPRQGKVLCCPCANYLAEIQRRSYNRAADS